MYDLFNSRYHGNNKTFPIVQLRTNKAVIQRELIRVCAFYRARPLEVGIDESHVISRLIKILNISFKRDAEAVIRACIERTPIVAKQLGLIHPYNNKPVEQIGVFYNDFVRDVIMLDETTPVNVDTVTKNWAVLNTISILSHPFNDINFHLCNGKYPKGKSGYAVYVVNVPMLILQYHCWVRDQYKKNVEVISPGRFIAQIVIPNMLGCHMDIAYINRAMDLFVGKLVPVMKRCHPVSIVDITQHVDTVIDLQIKILNSETIDINNFFRVFPAINRPNWASSMNVPDIAPNQNVRWALVLSVIKYVNFMVDYYFERDKSRLRQISSPVIRSIRSIKNNKEFKGDFVVMAGQMLDNIQNKLS